MPRIAGQGSKYIASAHGAYAKGDHKHPTMRSIADSLSCNRAVAPRSHKASRPTQAGKWQDLTLAPDLGVRCLVETHPSNEGECLAWAVSRGCNLMSSAVLSAVCKSGVKNEKFRRSGIVGVRQYGFRS